MAKFIKAQIGVNSFLLAGSSSKVFDTPMSHKPWVAGVMNAAVIINKNGKVPCRKFTLMHPCDEHVIAMIFPLERDIYNIPGEHKRLEGDVVMKNVMVFTTIEEVNDYNSQEEEYNSREERTQYLQDEYDDHIRRSRGKWSGAAGH